jgi:hypothetical protein
MFLACHVVAPLSSHPFTIASLPQDGKIEFVVRAKKGATKRFFKYAEKMFPNLPSNSSGQKVGRSVLIDGPYATIRPLRQFDSLVFLAGSTGATYTMPLMRDIVQQWMGVRSGSSSRFDPPVGAVTRYIKFVWVVKRSSAVSWFASQLDQVVRDVETLRKEGNDIAVDITIYVTCDNGMTSSKSSINGDRVEASGALSRDEKGIASSTTEFSSRPCYCNRFVATKMPPLLRSLLALAAPETNEHPPPPPSHSRNLTLSASTPKSCSYQAVHKCQTSSERQQKRHWVRWQSLFVVRRVWCRLRGILQQ